MGRLARYTRRVSTDRSAVRPRPAGTPTAPCAVAGAGAGVAAGRGHGGLLSPLAASLAAIACLWAPVAAAAQSCDTPQLETTPGEGAKLVATDARIKVRYVDQGQALSALWARFEAGDELIRLLDLGMLHSDDDGAGDGRATAIPGTLSRGGETGLFFEPDGLLSASHRFQVQYARPATVGMAEYRFDTGVSTDDGPPSFDFDEGAVELNTRAPGPECDAEEGSLAVQLRFPGAHDDSDRGAVEHSAFLTRARGLAAPRLLVTARPVQETVVLNFVLSEEESHSPVCVGLRAVDGVGNLADNQPEICFDPIQGSFFRPMCSLASRPGARRGSDSASGAAFLLWFALAVGVMRRRGRGAPGSATYSPIRPEDPA